MEIIWTDEAQEDLLAITRYYLDCAGRRTADNMFRKITDTVARLSAFPFIGQRVAGYDDLIEGECVIVISVWDCRQDPATLETELEVEE